MNDAKHEKCLRHVCPVSSSAPRPLGAAYIPILLSEVEQEQRPSGNGDRKTIGVGDGLCDNEGERAYTGYAPHIIRNVSANVFSVRRFGIFFAKRPPPSSCRNVFSRNVRNPTGRGWPRVRTSRLSQPRLQSALWAAWPSS